MIASFLPRLVTAISDIVQPVSDQCLAKGLISYSVYKKVLESGGTSEDKARTLILAVKTSTEIDSRCLQIVLSILEEQLPHAIKDTLLSAIRKALNETCSAVFPSTQIIQVQSGELAKEMIKNESYTLGKFENSIRQYEHACAEKKLLEERLTNKSKECEKLKDELESMRAQNQETAATIQHRITAISNQIENLRGRISELQHTIEEQDMHVKRGRTTFHTGLNMLQQIIQQEIKMKEKEHNKLLRETEAFASQKTEEEIRTKEREYRLAIQEKDLRIQEFELNLKQYEESTTTSLIPEDILYPCHLLSLHHSMTNDADIRCLDVLARKLGFTNSEIGDIHQKCEYDGYEEIEEMLQQWLEWYPGDSRGSTSYATHSALLKALMETGNGDVARYLILYEDLN